MLLAGGRAAAAEYDTPASLRTVSLCWYYNNDINGLVREITRS